MLLCVSSCITFFIWLRGDTQPGFTLRTRTKAKGSSLLSLCTWRPRTDEELRQVKSTKNSKSIPFF